MNTEREKINNFIYENITEGVITHIDERIKELVNKNNKRVLHIISLSDDPASAVYMKNKVNMGEKYGVKVIIHKPKDKEELHSVLNIVLDDINNRVIIQCPYDEEKWGTLSGLLKYIPDWMDVDGFKFNIMDLSRIKDIDQMFNNPNFSPTAKGAILLIDKAYKGMTKGKHVTVLGKGLTSGMPIALMCEQLGYTVTWCNSNTLTKVREDIIRNSKVIVSCVGKEMINKNLHSEVPNACYINVGMFKDDESGKLKADINYNDISELDNTLYCNKLFNTTGKLTTMCLILNTVL